MYHSFRLYSLLMFQWTVYKQMPWGIILLSFKYLCIKTSLQTNLSFTKVDKPKLWWIAVRITWKMDSKRQYHCDPKLVSPLPCKLRVFCSILFIQVGMIWVVLNHLHWTISMYIVFLGTHMEWHFLLKNTKVCKNSLTF